MNKRASGVLMHVSSLPGAYGIGCFGKEAKEFIDFLSDTGCTYWQVLPFTPTDAYNSPYASISAFAGNRNFIDLEQLRDEGLLTDDELREQMYANPYSAAFDFWSCAAFRSYTAHLPVRTKPTAIRYARSPRKTRAGCRTTRCISS